MAVKATMTEAQQPSCCLVLPLVALTLTRIATCLVIALGLPERIRG